MTASDGRCSWRTERGHQPGWPPSFRFILPALSTHLRVFRDAGPVSECKVGQNRFYSINREKMSEMTRFSGTFWDEGMRERVESREATRR